MGWEGPRGAPRAFGPWARGIRRRRGSNPWSWGSRQAGRSIRPAPVSRDAGTSALRGHVGGHRGRRKCRRAARREALGRGGSGPLPPPPRPRSRRPRRCHGHQRLQVAGVVALRLPGGGRRRRRGLRRAAGPGPGAGRARRHPLRVHTARVRGRGGAEAPPRGHPGSVRAPAPAGGGTGPGLPGAGELPRQRVVLRARRAGAAPPRPGSGCCRRLWPTCLPFPLGSSMYYDEDGDLAHEFYEETIVTKNGRKRAKLKRIHKNLIPQVGCGKASAKVPW